MFPFNHRDGENYPAWHTAVLDIFRMDWNVFEYDNSRAFLIISGALEGTAFKKAGPFYEACGVHGTQDPEYLIEFLDRLNLDSMCVFRANDQLYVMRIKDNQRWPDLYDSWSIWLTEARGKFWPDKNKFRHYVAYSLRSFLELLMGITFSQIMTSANEFELLMKLLNV